MRHLIGLAPLATLAACVSGPASGPGPAPVNDVGSVAATLYDGEGNIRGEADIAASDGGVRVTLRAFGLAPGAHGFHIHETGDCDPPEFASAGGHWNPLGREHGRESAGGQHMGDMPNLIVGQAGEGYVELTIEGATIARGRTALLDEDGAAIVIHAAADDYVSQPSGAAGPRIACGVLAPR